MKIRITSKTHDERGKKRSWTRILSGYIRTTSKADIKRFIEKNIPGLFKGCSIEIEMPDEKFYGIVDPDTHRFNEYRPEDQKYEGIDYPSQTFGH